MDDRSRATVRGTPAARRVRGFALLLCVSIASVACQSRPSRPHNTVADWPLKFVQHNFGTICFSTYGCTVDYNAHRHIAEPDAILQSPSSEAHPDTLRNLPAGYVGTLGFPPPAVVRWRSKDGSAHETQVDIGAIFADGLIRHDVPREDMPEGVSIGNPDVLLVVDDRTITVYMRAFVPTKSVRIPGNPHSNFRKDPVLAWSRTW